MPTERELLARTLRRICELLGTVKTKSGELASQIGVAEPESPKLAQILSCTARLLAKSPDMEGIDPLHSGWRQRSVEIRAIVEAGTQMRISHATFGPVLLPEAWDCDIAYIEVHSRLGSRWWRWLSPSWRKASKEFARLFAKGLPKDGVDPSALLDGILSIAARKRSFERVLPCFRSCSGPIGAAVIRIFRYWAPALSGSQRPRILCTQGQRSRSA